MRMNSRVRVVCGVWVLMAWAVSAVHGDQQVIACWNSEATASWMDAANWTPCLGGPELPDPGYPGTNYWALVSFGTAVVGSADAAVAYVQLDHGGGVNVESGRAFTCSEFLNRESTESKQRGNLVIADGHANVYNAETATVYDVLIRVGGDAAGYLDLGATWGATGEFPQDFGTLANVDISLVKGGLRADAESIAMTSGCALSNAGQEMTFRGDWLNPDASTTLTLVGSGADDITIGGDLSFGGCVLELILDTNGISPVKVSGDAILTNAALKIGTTAALGSPSNSYDLVRVPAANSIQTNDMTVSVHAQRGIECTASIDENRGGYDYLVLTTGNFAPTATITNPVDMAIYYGATDITISATASDSDGSVTKVEFYSGDSKLGEDTSSPYAYVWSNVLGGRYYVKAVAVDNDGGEGVSPIVTLNVEGTNADGKIVFTAGDVTITYDKGCVEPYDE